MGGTLDNKSNTYSALSLRATSVHNGIISDLQNWSGKEFQFSETIRGRLLPRMPAVVINVQSRLYVLASLWFAMNTWFMWLDTYLATVIDVSDNDDIIIRFVLY